MKKGTLILLGMFLMVSTVEAKKSENRSNRFGVNYYAYNNAVNFFERGIEFFVFANGDFDFNTNFTNRRIQVDRDFDGRIRRIGNVGLRYDFRGNITRIGDIRINYFRNRLRNVGNLRVRYDNWGYPVFYGNVRNFYYDNGVRFNINFGDVCNYNDVFFRNNNFRRNYVQIREDRNFFYYRARPNARIGNRSTIIKRRKPDAIKGNNNIISRRKTTNVYRKNELSRRSSSHGNIRGNTKNRVHRNEVRSNSNLKNQNSNSKKRTLNRFDRNVKDQRNVNRRKSDVKKKVLNSEIKKRK